MRGVLHDINLVLFEIAAWLAAIFAYLTARRY